MKKMVGKARILIVDDEPHIICPLLLYFSKRGYDVVVTNSSMSVLSSVMPHGFDIIITDFNMEHLNGIEIINHARRAGFNGKIILMSACCDLNKAERDALGIDAFFEKPFELGALHSQVKEWAENQPVC